MHQPLISITRKQALIFALFFVLYEFLIYIANDMIMPGMIKVVATFHAPESAIASSLTAYLLGGASLQLILGPISDRFGRRPVMLVGAVFFFLSTLLIACTNSIGQFLLMRFFEGMGLCFICVIGYATIQEIFEEMDAIRLIAAMANISVLAPLLGPLLGATFVCYYSWRWIFVVIAGFALLSLWGLWRYMPEPVGQTTRLGHEIKSEPFLFPVIMANYKQLLKNKAFIFGSIATGVLGLPCVIWIGLAPVIMVTKAHASMIEYGLWQMPIFGAFIAGNVLLQYMTHKSTVTKMIAFGTLISSVSLLVMFVLPCLFGTDYIWLTPGLITYFFGYGLVAGPLSRFTLYSTAVSKGTASALMSMIGICVQAVGIEVANYAYEGLGNLFFGFYCALAGMVYIVLVWGMFHFKPNESLEFSPKP